MQATKPIVAVGAEHPLEDETLMADHFRKPLLRKCLATVKYLTNMPKTARTDFMVSMSSILIYHRPTRGNSSSITVRM